MSANFLSEIKLVYREHFIVPYSEELHTLSSNTTTDLIRLKTKEIDEVYRSFAGALGVCRGEHPGLAPLGGPSQQGVDPTHDGHHGADVEGLGQGIASPIGLGGMTQH